MDIAMESTHPPPVLLQPFQCIPGSCSIYNPWIYLCVFITPGCVHSRKAPAWCQPLAGVQGSALGSGQPNPALPDTTALLGTALSQSVQSHLQKKGFCCSVWEAGGAGAAISELDFKPQAGNAPAELRWSSSGTCGGEGRKKPREKQTQQDSSSLRRS